MASVKVQFIEGAYSSVSSLVRDLVSAIVDSKLVSTTLTADVAVDDTTCVLTSVVGVVAGVTLNVGFGSVNTETIVVGEVNTETKVVTIANGGKFAKTHATSDVVRDCSWELAYPATTSAIQDHAVIKHQIPNGPMGYFEFQRESTITMKNRTTGLEATKENFYAITCKMGINYDTVELKWGADSDSVPARYSWFMSDTASNIKSWLPVQYWISINHKRFTMVLSGDPSASFSDRLISWGYFGEVKSFDGALPDTQGNLAMVVSSDESPFVYLERNPAATKLSGVVTANQSTIGVASVTNMFVGQNLILGTGATKETVTIDSIEGTTITLVSSTTYGHASNEDVVGERLLAKYSDKTGTGVVDIVMLKTASGYPMQAHYPSFTTPDEFVDKALEGPSAYTKKYHMSPVYVFHGFDSYRGELDGVAVTDRSSIVHLDDMIIDKDLPTEKVYKSFLVNAPYSMFNNASNSMYAIAILKYEK
jgi:hypothetical protein